MSVPRREPGGADGLADQVERGPVAVEAGREAALVAEAGREALLLQHRLERVVDLGAGAQRLGEGRRADRRDHELLDVDVGVGVRAAVEDVHHRHRQQVGVGPADVAVERQPGRLGRGLGHGERDAEDRVGAEVGLVGGAVELDHRLVDLALVVGAEALDGRADLLDHRVDGLLHALAEVAVAAVAQLDGLELPRGRAARHGRAAERAVVEQHLDLDGGVAARVEDLAGADSFDGCHVSAPWDVDVVDLDGRPHPIGAVHRGNRVRRRVDRLRPATGRWQAWRSPSRRTPPCSTALRRLRPERRAVLRGDGPGSRGPAARCEPARRRSTSARVAARSPSRSRTPSARPAAWTPSTSLPAWCVCSPRTPRTSPTSTSPRATPPTRGRPRRRTTSIASSMVIFFLDDPTAALTRWRALLRPGGRLGVATFQPWYGTLGGARATLYDEFAEDPLPTDIATRPTPGSSGC